jgi:hypothetical protein
VVGFPTWPTAGRVSSLHSDSCPLLVAPAYGWRTRYPQRGQSSLGGVLGTPSADAERAASVFACQWVASVGPSIAECGRGLVALGPDACRLLVSCSVILTAMQAAERVLVCAGSLVSWRCPQLTAGRVHCRFRLQQQHVGCFDAAVISSGWLLVYCLSPYTSAGWDGFVTVWSLNNVWVLAG